MSLTDGLNIRKLIVEYAWKENEVTPTCNEILQAALDGSIDVVIILNIDDIHVKG